jgi:hypothetical protein
MKLRIKGNSIRLRLLRSEVERFAAEGSISDAVRFGETTLRYSLSMSSDAGSIQSKFENGEILVIIPENTGRDWANGDDVGLETEQPIRNGETLSILIEKDFVCIGRPDDPDRHDAFPVAV